MYMTRFFFILQCLILSNLYPTLSFKKHVYFNVMDLSLQTDDHATFSFDFLFSEDHLNAYKLCSFAL